MPYTPQTWFNGEGGATPVSAPRLTYMEEGIEAAMAAAEDGGGGGATFYISIASSEAPAAHQDVADYVCTGTNDETVIANAINTAATDSAFYNIHVRLSGGTFYFGAALAISGDAANRKIIIEGSKPGVSMISHTGAYINEGVTWLEKTATGDFGLITSTQSIKPLILKDMQLYDSGSGATTASMITLTGPTLLHLDGISAYWWEGSTSMINAATQARIKMTDCHLEGAAQILLAQSKRIMVDIDRSYLYGSVYAIEVTNAGHSTTVHVKDSYLDNGLRVDGDGAVSPRPDVRLDNSRFVGDTAAPDAVYLSDVRYLQMNTCFVSAADSGIRLNNVDGGKVLGNTIDGTGQHGLWILDSDKIVVDDNTFEYVSGDTANTYCGILLDGDTNDCSITNNHLLTTTALNGIRVDDSTCDNNLIEGNSLRSSSQTAGNEFFDAGTGTRGWQVRELTYVAGTLTVANGAKRVRFDRGAVLGLTYLNVNTAPTGAALLVDVNKNGTTVYTTQASRPTVAISGTSGQSVALPDVKTIAAGDYLTADVDVIGSTIAGADLVVLQRFMPL